MRCGPHVCGTRLSRQSEPQPLIVQACSMDTSTTGRTLDKAFNDLVTHDNEPLWFRYTTIWSKRLTPAATGRRTGERWRHRVAGWGATRLAGLALALSACLANGGRTSSTCIFVFPSARTRILHYVIRPLVLPSSLSVGSNIWKRAL